MSQLRAMDKRLKALESRPTAQRPLRIIGGLPSGAEQIRSMTRAAQTMPQPLAPALANTEEVK
jgi:hypothetical protein